MDNREKLKLELLDMGFTEEDLKGKREKALAEMVNAYQSIEELLDDEETEEKYQQVDPGVSMQSPEWHDYVMSHFTEDELFEGKYPLCTGLRRVVELLLGNILFSGPIQVWHQGVQKTSVLYKIEIEWMQGVVSVDFTQPMQTKVFTELADATLEYTPFPFVKHLDATAATKAESRTLRKMLKLKVCAAEEITGQNEIPELSGGITQTQVVAIRTNCQREDIEVPENLAEFTSQQAKEFLAEITKRRTE